MSRHWTKVVVASALAFCCVPALADGDETSSISGTGQVVLRPKATTLRFQLTLSERGDDMEQVEKSLGRKCEALCKALLAAKAASGSIRIDTARLVGGLRAVGAAIQGQQPWGKGKWQYQTPVRKPTIHQVYSIPSASTPAFVYYRPAIATLNHSDRTSISVMAKQRSNYQDRVIRNYYQNRDDIMLQRLGELVTDLYLAEGKTKLRIWKRVAEILEKLKVPKSEIERLVRSDNPTLVANVLKKLLEKL